MVRLGFMLVILLTLASQPVMAEEPLLRHPLAAAWLGADRLAVANERGGTLSLVDAHEGLVLDEARIGRRLSDLAVDPAHNLLLAIDSATHEAILVSLVDNRLVPIARADVCRYPASVSLSRKNRQAYVAGLWSRRLDFLQLTADGTRITGLTVQHSLELPFAPRRQLLLPGDRYLVVAGAFGGELAVIDVRERKLLHVRSLLAHNIAGLAWDAEHDRLLIAHQILHETAPTDADNVQWGALMKNVVRVVEKVQLLDASVNLTTATQVISIGREGDGGADPAGVAALPDGQFAVTSGGLDYLAFVDSIGYVYPRLPVGRRPVAIVATPDQQRLAVLNQFDDSVSIVDAAGYDVTATIRLGKQPKLSAADRGERLFYDGRLSFDGWLSCHSCHTDGHTNELLADTAGDDSYGAPKRVLSLLGTRDTDRWAWNGEIKELHDQVRKSVHSTMHGQATAEQVFDLTAFLHTLDAPPPRQPASDDPADRALLERGRAVFQKQRCDRCHIPPLTYTSQDAYDVGLTDKLGRSKFNPPSLRGVGHRPAFFHDKRARSLADVFATYAHQLDEPLSDQELAELVRFLESL